MQFSQGQIFWREMGQGTALVFLHGSWSDSSQWLPVVEQLSARYHCFVPDLLGFGDSEHPKTHYSIGLEVECLSEYLEALKLRQIYLIGHSVGGWIAASYALKCPEQVQGLVLVAPEGMPVESLPNRWWVARWLVSRPPIVAWILRSFLPLSRWLGWHRRVEQLLQLRRQLLESPVACKLLFRRRAAEIKAEFLQDRLSWLKMPVLILQGEDSSTASTLSRAYSEQVPDAVLDSLPHKTDDLLVMLPDRVANQIHAFVSGVADVR